MFHTNPPQLVNCSNIDQILIKYLVPSRQILIKFYANTDQIVSSDIILLKPAAAAKAIASLAIATL